MKTITKDYIMKENEPTLEQIEDYNGNESAEKSRTIKMVILGLLIVGGIYAALKIAFNDVSDYVGTKENPGISTTKGH